VATGTLSRSDIETPGPTPRDLTVGSVEASALAAGDTKEQVRRRPERGVAVLRCMVGEG
jgi:hypothetical protein